MEMHTTQSMFEVHGMDDRQIRNGTFADWIKKIVISIYEARRHKQEYRNLLEQPDWIFRDIGLTRQQVLHALNDNRPNFHCMEND